MPSPPPRCARLAALLAGTLGLLLLLLPAPARGLFHLAVIDEILASLDDDPTLQFVEIKMLAQFQNFVQNSVLAVFDANGDYLGDVLVLPTNVANAGNGVRVLIATSAFAQHSGLTPDFLMDPALPVAGGMVCWGAPGNVPPAPDSWDHTQPANYVDCVAYGGYVGPSNVHIGDPTPLVPEGHSLARVSDGDDNATDFACADPATPRNNAGERARLAATVPCPEPGAWLSGVALAAVAGLAQRRRADAARRRPSGRAPEAPAANGFADR